MLDKLFVLSQYVTPQLAVSRLAGRLADSESTPALKNRVIKWFIGRYGVNMSEAAEPDFTAYPTFNAFFTRALKPGARTIDPAPETLTSPVDGAISQIGQISTDRVFQAKGQSFSLTELLGGDDERAEPFREGEFATIYLSPKDYHRIHMPMAGTLKEMVYVPGKLFSVNPVTAENVPNLFARNERVACLFDTEAGPMAMVLVGAMIVGSVETTWGGVVAPNSGKVTQWQYSGEDAVRFEKGQEMGRFRLGSTVVLVMPRGAVKWQPNQVAEKTVQLGEAFGKLHVE
ncbi:MAG TPA: phosphatidylserine decarboxylase [Marinobacter hydrocarbonoclasticus]|jgi:phosphatidylserine decarboxylase|uniref:archaetidylserine decarboxylase n=1 Tax=Marinobacter TaxID=2742 RepID=UPI000C5E58CB|nr:MULTISPECIES: archaetidylserine decarboxylase [unclassified Marinobacter]MEC9085237.1 archaetidylserine decarboxylase [Pseudomonadota bacterium]HAX09146.1 phosphatidylserine decarboxylase [Marinobacter nauticus]MAC21036.1 phosphatidylserine decarboxylase [Marinobacter sp.]MAP31825.1 phosphatidylserine decarboxylase [Marinobacter sp.]MBH91813.1 phosphatidylserine decarboxylase [Marinobacter sp.]|tara:strand:- start:1489 stop:2349 length:861 start_codon:yes stop_codon:yes gene_type:complete